MKKIVVFIALFIAGFNSFNQNIDSLFIEKLFSNALNDTSFYQNLRYLCKKIGGRIGGSDQASKAVTWTKNTLEKVGADTVFFQNCFVRKWTRGNKEECYIINSQNNKQSFNVCALGGSVSTGISGISGKIIQVKSLKELEAIGTDKIKGNIVFFNRAADPSNYNTFVSYGGAADQRVIGASIAASYGAVASVCRSLTVYTHPYPHTGIMHYIDSLPKIPAFAIGTTDADMLDKLIRNNPNQKLFLKSNCAEFPEIESSNVVGEIKGSKYPDQIILIGAHLDAWDIGEGAHDDGAGIVEIIDLLRLFKSIGYQPEHTIRVVAYMDEEMAQRGAEKYAELAKANNERHIAAIESDEGGFLPLGFSYDFPSINPQIMEKWKSLLEPYGLWNFHKGYSGVDIRELKSLGVPLFGLMTDSQRYFKYQHASTDVFEAIEIRELQLGTASIAAFVFLIDKYGL